MAVTQEEQYRTAISYISIIIVGFATMLNMIGIYLIRKQRSQRTNQLIIILNLSCLQIPMLGVVLMYWILRLAHVKGTDAILIWNMTLLTSSRVAIGLMMAILTADRLFAIRYSFKYMRIVSKGRVKAALVASWLSWVVSFSILRSLPVERYKFASYYIVAPIVDCSLLLFILYTYSYIYWRISKRRRTLSNISTQSQQMRHGNKQALRVSSTIILSYVVLLLLPDYAESILRKLVEGKALEFGLLTAYLLNTSYLISLPMTYIFLHRSMRNMLKDIVMNCSRKRAGRPNKTSKIVLTEDRVQISKL